MSPLLVGRPGLLSMPTLSGTGADGTGRPTSSATTLAGPLALLATHPIGGHMDIRESFTAPTGASLAARLAGAASGQGSGDHPDETPLPRGHSSDPRSPLPPLTPPRLFDVGDRVRIIQASRAIDDATDRLAADLDTYIERVRRIGLQDDLARIREQGRRELELVKQARGDAMLAATVGLRVVRGGQA